jgi:peroxiredoxin Q/BCP
MNVWQMVGHQEGAMIREGEQAPAFEADIQDGSRVVLGDWLSRGPVVLYFYPKDFTPG